MAQPITLADAGLKERQHLQEWVIAHPEILGVDVKIVAFEFGRWSNSGGSVAHDRLDVLGLDRTGRLVVTELKRDKAPDTVDMQALKYAALVSRFTIEDLAKVHAAHLNRLGAESDSSISVESAEQELRDWSPDLSEETLRVPRLILIATEFPKTVTATVVFLHQALLLDVRLVTFQAYQTTNEVLVTVSQHYPPPDVEEFILSPEVQEAQKKKIEKQTQQREVSAVTRIRKANSLPNGTKLEFRAPTQSLRDLVEPWLEAEPARRYATWHNDGAKPLKWQHDGEWYSPSRLTVLILEAVGRPGSYQGPL